MSTWGATTLHILAWPEGSYRGVSASAGIIEIPILPDPSGNAPASVIQQVGRMRKRVTFDGYVTSLANYNSLLADHLAATQRTFTGPDGETLDAIISELSPPERYQSNHIRFLITLLEGDTP